MYIPGFYTLILYTADDPRRMEFRRRVPYLEVKKAVAQLRATDRRWKLLRGGKVVEDS